MGSVARILSGFLVFIFILTACGKKGGASKKASSPEELVELLNESGKLRDGGAFFDLLSAESAKKFEAKLKIVIKLTLSFAKKSADKINNTELKKKYEKLKTLAQAEGREFFIHLFKLGEAYAGKKIAQMSKNYKILSKKIEGNKALVVVETGGIKQNFDLVKEEGSWKLDLTSILDFGKK